MNPNERQATLNGIIWNAALREMPFLRSAALFLAEVQQAHGARKALQRNKNGYFAAARHVLTGPRS